MMKKYSTVKILIKFHSNHFISFKIFMVLLGENFQVTFQDLLVASSDTSNSFLEAAVLYLIAFPTVQEKIYQEILDIAVDGRVINFEDRKRYLRNFT